ncbi:fructokinase [Brevibacillus reuszeri]|uniref:Fructokinase n=1 Tax=Brevibacillus reuszeri TaxID=54915 RepID=A0A0K9YMH9_9BACL|nr:carbohydrate kinase [Brevibacillus reuszeri]KNB69370.1 sugar kinase [Brevibacillus reuszeri]MED1860322.1 carbohydrate kinase [Brevibacillus reuszeri]GED70790.1 fructokinase [Brevibacillus reuszeri]
MLDVVACGELLIDFTPTSHAEKGKLAFEQNPGGAPANVLTALSRLGKRTSFVGAVGNDAFGQFLKQTLLDLNIGTTGLIMTSEAPTTLAFVHINEHADRSFHFYRNPGADTLLRETDIDEELIGQARIFHFGSLSLTHEPARAATKKAVEIAKNNHRLVSFDPNYRASLWDDEDEAKRIILSGISQANIVKLSEEEVVFLAPTGDVNEATDWLMQEYGNQLILVTLGAKGCFYRTHDHCGIVQGFKVDAVDTTGAGDAFFGGMLHQILEVKEDIATRTQTELEQMIRFANAVGALATTKTGAIPAMPSLEEVERFTKAGL